MLYGGSRFKVGTIAVGFDTTNRKPAKVYVPCLNISLLKIVVPFLSLQYAFPCKSTQVNTL